MPLGNADAAARTPTRPCALDQARPVLVRAHECADIHLGPRTARHDSAATAALEHRAVVVPRAVALAARVVELLAVLGHREVRHDVGVAHVDQLGVARVVLLVKAR